MGRPRADALRIICARGADGAKDPCSKWAPTRRLNDVPSRTGASRRLRPDRPAVVGEPDMRSAVGSMLRLPPQIGETLVFGLLGVGLGLLLMAGKERLYSLQGGVSEAASLLPLGYAYAAGMVAAVNPCGILLMPSLVAYYLGSDRSANLPWWARTGKAFLLGGMATGGFVALFAGVGAVFVAGGRALAGYFPVAGLAVGVTLALLGTWMMVTGGSLGVASASRAMGAARIGADLRSLFVFGVAYGVASLACTLPVFLVVVGTALAAAGPLEALGQFLGYALGMGMMLTAVTVAAAFFRDAAARWLRGIVPYVHRVAASLLLGAGIFIVYYWLEPSGILR